MNAIVIPINWQAVGACTAEDPELFFGLDGEPDAKRAEREAVAKAVCARCIVSDRCLRFAVDEEIVFGVYGQTGELERADLIREARKAIA